MRKVIPVLVGIIGVALATLGSSSAPLVTSKTVTPPAKHVDLFSTKPLFGPGASPGPWAPQATATDGRRN